MSGVAHPVPVIGLTGGIGSGKSAAARILAEDPRVAVIDADRIARELGSEGGRAASSILARFGTIDRVRLRELIFSETSARSDLEAILHPLIREESQLAIDAAVARGARLVIYEAALLVETGRYRDFDGLLVIEAPAEVRAARVMARDGCTEAQARAAIAAQASDQARREAATWLLTNSGNLDTLRFAVSEWLRDRLAGI